MFAKKKNFIVATSLAILAGIAAYVILLRPSGRQEDDKASRTGKAVSGKRIAASRKSATRKDPKTAVRDVLADRHTSHQRIGDKPGFDEFLDELAPKDRSLVLAVQDALDADNFESVAKAADVALCSTNPVVREAAVEALGWFGEQALPELTPLLADADEDVAEAAMSQWQLALGEIEEDSTRAEIAEAVMKTLVNKDALELIVCEITGQDDDFTILESLVSIIEDNNAVGAEVAREAYEELTGEEWTNIEAANRWLEEFYDPPEPSEDE